ncbi:hypothetical protein Hypma_011276 [Hypsizygus marmoreus]|uniref:Uncharacterized protein n=1 Tax=Hypsizygus marmoreus TaxID=39966 RepID=A0A369JMP8_HYPMA|nr:hypothetical protein Hypma_011276 [Hypsizygus marmoreus]
MHDISHETLTRSSSRKTTDMEREIALVLLKRHVTVTSNWPGLLLFVPSPLRATARSSSRVECSIISPHPDYPAIVTSLGRRISSKLVMDFVLRVEDTRTPSRHWSFSPRLFGIPPRLIYECIRSPRPSPF